MSTLSPITKAYFQSSSYKLQRFLEVVLRRLTTSRSNEKLEMVFSETEDVLPCIILEKTFNHVSYVSHTLNLMLIGNLPNRVWMVWEFELEESYPVFSSRGALLHHGKEEGAVVYGKPNVASKEKNLDRRLWVVEYPANLEQLFRMYDKTAQLYGYDPIFNLPT